MLPIWGRALGASSIFTTRTGRRERTISIGRPVSGAAAVVGGAGTFGVALSGPKAPGVVGAVAGRAGCGLGFVVAVVDDVAGRAVVVVGFGRVVVVVGIDVVVVGAGLTVSTRRRSVPQALPATKTSTASLVHSDCRWLWGLSAVMSTGDGTGPERQNGGPWPQLPQPDASHLYCGNEPADSFRDVHPATR